MTKKEMLIVGGAGQFGAFYAKFFKENGFKVKIFDIDKELAEKQAKLLGIECCNSIDCVKAADFVAISVPINAAVDCVKSLFPLVKENCLVFDFCSVKTTVCKELEKHASKGIEIASIHPMHGPRIESLVNVPVVFIPIKPRKKYVEIKGLFEAKKARVFEASAEEHDKALSVVQGLTHFVQIASAKAIGNTGLELERIKKYSSPLFELFLGTIARVALQNPELYAAIQTSNPFNTEMRKAFLEAAASLDKTIQGNSIQSIAKEISLAAEIFKKQECFFHQADFLVNQAHSEVYLLDKLKETKILLQNVFSKKYHYGAIRKILFKEHEMLFKESGKEIKLQIDNIRLCSKNEMDEWRKKNLKTIERDYSFSVDKNCNEEAIRKALSSVKRAQFILIDSFSGKQIPKGKKSLTYKASFFEDESAEKIDKNITGLIEGLGFKRR